MLDLFSNSNKRPAGFTIVELLIVIVVIGILAGIVIVSYNQITEKAHDASRVSAIDAYTKIFTIYHTTHNEWPLPFWEEGMSPAIDPICLGSTASYPAVAGVFEEGQCLADASDPNAFGDAYRVDDTLNTKLAEVAKTPTINTKTSKLTDGSTTIGYARGIIYQYDMSDPALYYITGNDDIASCPRGEYTKDALAPGIAACVIHLSQ